MFFEIFVIGIIIGFVLGCVFSTSTWTKKISAKLDELLKLNRKEGE